MPIKPDWIRKPPGTMIRLARWIVQRFPLLNSYTHHFYRQLQPRFTVGAVGVLLSADGKIFLVRHVFHGTTPWGLPGGWVDADELPEDAVRREFEEETGLRVTVICPLAIWSNQYWRYHYDMAFLVKLADPVDVEVRLSSELTDYQWAEWEKLPRILPDQYRVIHLALRRYYPKFMFPDEEGAL
jgi:ADP-ribose pyrophosphatase YjhB (NUDIX family)